MDIFLIPNHRVMHKKMDNQVVQAVVEQMVLVLEVVVIHHLYLLLKETMVELHNPLELRLEVVEQVLVVKVEDQQALDLKLVGMAELVLHLQLMELQL